MARSDSPEPTSGLREHELVERLVPDPGAPPVYAVLRGFVGRSAEAGYWRMYLSSDLASYVDVLESDIAHVAEEPGQAQTVWVKREAVLRCTRVMPRRAQADFLRGEISADLSVSRVSDAVFLTDETALEAVPTRTAHTCVPATCTLAISCLTQPVCT